MISRLEGNEAKRRVVEYLDKRFTFDSNIAILVERLKDHEYCVDKDVHDRLLREASAVTR